MYHTLPVLLAAATLACAAPAPAYRPPPGGGPVERFCAAVRKGGYSSPRFTVRAEKVDGTGLYGVTLVDRHGTTFQAPQAEVSANADGKSVLLRLRRVTRKGANAGTAPLDSLPLQLTPPPPPRAGR